VDFWSHSTTHEIQIATVAAVGTSPKDRSAPSCCIWWEMTVDEPTLICAIGKYAGQVVRLSEGVSVTLGRDTTCTLSFPDDQYVSRQHAVIFFDRGSWCCKDMGSSNGTLVDNARVNPGASVPLFVGSVVKIGGQAFHFQDTGQRRTAAITKGWDWANPYSGPGAKRPWGFGLTKAVSHFDEEMRREAAKGWLAQADVARLYDIQLRSGMPQMNCACMRSETLCTRCFSAP
jgi:hypothetical protein